MHGVPEKSNERRKCKCGGDDQHVIASRESARALHARNRTRARWSPLEESLQVFCEFFGGLIALRRILLKKPRHDDFNIATQSAIHATDGRGNLIANDRGSFGNRASLDRVRQPSREALVEQYSHRVKITASIDRVCPIKLFRAHVGQRAHERIAHRNSRKRHRHHRFMRALTLRGGRPRECSRDTKIKHLHRMLGRDKDVAWLQVAMDDTRCMRVTNRVGDIEKGLHHFAHRTPRSPNFTATLTASCTYTAARSSRPDIQRHTIDELHHEKWTHGKACCVGTRVVNPRDMWMLEATE